MDSRILDFTKISPPVYYGSKTNEYPQELVDKFKKILYAMEVDEEAKAELTTYQLKDVAHL